MSIANFPQGGTLTLQQKVEKARRKWEKIESLLVHSHRFDDKDVYEMAKQEIKKMLDSL